MDSIASSLPVTDVQTVSWWATIAQFLQSNWTWVVGAVVVGFVLLQVRKAWQCRREETKSQLQEQRCQEVQEDEAIFISWPNTTLMLNEYMKLVHHALHQAYCPYRLVFGLGCASSAPEVVAAYRRHLLPGQTDLSSRLRVLGRTLPSGIISESRQWIHHYLFAGEPYYLTWMEKTWTTPDWDLHLRREYDAVTRRGPRVVLCAQGIPFDAHWLSFSPSTTHADMPTYLRFKEWNAKGGFRTEAISTMKRPRGPLPSLFFTGWIEGWAFGSSDMWTTQARPTLGMGDDFVGLRLWTRQYIFFHPSRALFYQLLAGEYEKELESINVDDINLLLDPHTRPIRGGEGIDRQDPMYVPLEVWEKYAGIQLVSQQITGLSGIMGVASDAEATEVLAKFGTWNRYRHIVDTLQKTLTETNGVV